MTVRNLTVDEQCLKEATRQLQKAIGGVESAGEITGKGKTRHGNYQSPNMDDSLPLLDIAKLERVAHGTLGYPQVTRLLCRNAGGVFVPMPQGVIGDDDLRQRMLDMMVAMGRTAEDLRTALEDGKIDRAEASGLRVDLRVWMETAAAMDRRLAEIEEGQ